MNKEKLRQLHKELRKNQKENNIFLKIISLPIYKEAKSIAIYYSTEEEVDTIKLIEYSLQDNKKVYLPRVIGKRQMVFYQITDLNPNNFTKSKFGIFEPIESTTTSKIDLTIVPGICFDKKKYRIGYGGGFYDTYLKNNKTYKIGICFDCNLIDTIPINKYDIPMDMVITEKNTIS